MPEDTLAQLERALRRRAAGARAARLAGLRGAAASMLDVSHDRVPTRDTLALLVARLARL
jgi:hypothetical protein